MAKIIVTVPNGKKYLVDSNSKFETSTKYNTVLVTTIGRGAVWMDSAPIKESMEEIQKRINEAEAAETESNNEKLDFILENQKKILKALRIQ